MAIIAAVAVVRTAKHEPAIKGEDNTLVSAVFQSHGLSAVTLERFLSAAPENR